MKTFALLLVCTLLGPWLSSQGRGPLPEVEARQASTKQAPKKQSPKEAGKKQAPKGKQSPKKGEQKPGQKDPKKADSKTAKTGDGKTAKTGDAKKGDGKAGEKSTEAGIKTRDADKSEIELPEGATEDDIRAIRGANAMLEAERRLEELLKKHKISGKTKFVRFDKLEGWPYEDGYKGMPKDIEKLNGKRIAMAGFMLPIDEVENIKTFYLVKSLWSCCYGVPPDVNGLVKVNVKAKKGCAYQYDPILIVGTFRLKKVMDEDYCICIFQLDDATVKVIQLD